MKKLLACALMVFVAGVTIVAGQGTSEGVTPALPMKQISGVVTDPVGAPVAGAIVTFYPGFQSNAVAVTDSQGRYQVELRTSGAWTGPVGPYAYLIVRDTNRNLAYIRGPQDSAVGLTIRLQPGVNISVNVKDTQGRPIANAVAQVTPMVSRSGTALKPDLVTDAEGRIEMKALPRGHDILLNIHAEGYGGKFLQARAAETDMVEYQFPDVTLAAADKEVSGRVVDEQGNPVAGMGVMTSVGNHPLSATTDDQGRFSIKGVTDETFNLSVNRTGSSGNAKARGGDKDVVIHLGRNPTQPPAFVEGTVTDQSNQPVAGARVALIPLNGPNNYTDEQGHYRIDLPTGVTGVAAFQWSVFAQDKARNLAVLQWVDQSSTHVDLQLKQGVTLAAKFQDEKGRPVTKAYVNLMLLAGSGRYVLDPRLPVDANGAIEAVATPAGQRIALEFQSRGQGTESLEPDPRETIGKARYEFPTVTMKSANQIVSGRVLDESGKPLAQVSVVARGPNQPGDQTHTDEEGRFTLHEIMEGDVQLSTLLPAPQGGPVSANVTTKSGDTNVVLRLVKPRRAATVDLTDALNVSGSVKDELGAPVAGAVVSTVPPSADFTDAVTDQDGNYSLNWRPAKTVAGAKVPMRIMARDVARNRVAVLELEEVTGTKVLVLKQGLDLTGSVTERTGEPVAGASVQLNMTRSEPPDRPFTIQVLREPVTSDEHGGFEIKALPRGWEYGFRVTAEDHAIATTNITVVDSSGKAFKMSAIQMEKVDQWIAGTVVDTNGKPVREVTIQVRDQGLTNMNAYTDADGHFKLRVHEGPLTVFAIYNPASRSEVSTQARLRANGGDTNLVLRLAPLAFPSARNVSAAPR